VESTFPLAYLSSAYWPRLPCRPHSGWSLYSRHCHQRSTC